MCVRERGSLCVNERLCVCVGKRMRESERESESGEERE